MGLDLKQRLERAVELSDEQVEKLFGHHSLSSMAEGTWRPVGARAENARLRPLLTALIACAESAEEFVNRYEDVNDAALNDSVVELKRVLGEGES